MHYYIYERKKNKQTLLLNWLFVFMIIICPRDAFGWSENKPLPKMLLNVWNIIYPGHSTCSIVIYK